VGAVPKRLGVAAILLAVGLVVGIAAVVVPMLRPPGPRPAFELPVACGETWRLGTYRGHDDYDVDLFPTSGRAWGRPVLASAAGTVVSAGLNGTLGGRTPANPDGPQGRGGGYLVKIDHGGKWESLYLHLLEPPLVRPGQRVALGDRLGSVGSTGDSSAPHLHYEQLRDGEKVETHFAGVPSGITHDDRDYSVTRRSGNCPAAPARVPG
jgi:murein DD-endopeptidase MepM/ murein hydrolase activator NlpD